MNADKTKTSSLLASYVSAFFRNLEKNRMLTHGSSAGIFVLVILLAGCQPKQSASLHLSPMLEALTIFARRDF